MKNLNAVGLRPRQILRQIKLKSFNIKDILTVSSPVGQGDRHSKLREAIRRRDLTLSLEILEEYGFHGDLGIIAIRCIQDLGRAV